MQVTIKKKLQVPFLNLAQQHQNQRREIENAVLAVLSSANYTLGPNVRALEEELPPRFGCRHGIGVNSGSDALIIALRALELKAGDEVITTPFTYIAPAEAIHECGAKIVFADIDPFTFNIDPKDIARKISKKTRAIIPVHLFGLPADLKEIMALARKHRLKVVEDVAQAVGATYQEKAVGGFGDISITSFYPTKNLGADGDGGMLFTNSEKLAQKCRLLRVHGRVGYFYHGHGIVSRLHELQAAILKVKARKISEWNEARRRIARRYSEQLMDVPAVTPGEFPDRTHVFHAYTIRVSRRDQMEEHLRSNGVSTSIYYPLPLHLQKIYRDLGYKRGSLKVSEKAAKEVISLPIYPELTMEQQDYVIGQIQNFFKR